MTSLEVMWAVLSRLSVTVFNLKQKDRQLLFANDTVGAYDCLDQHNKPR